VAADDPVAGMLAAHGFETYAQMVPMARPLQGMPRAPGVPLELVPYRNEWAEAFAEAQDAAMGELAVAREMGTPTGYETAEGFDAFVVAKQGERILGFAQAALPEGWINWLGVVPEARRQGLGSALVGEIAKAVAAARGTHLAALVEQGTPGQAFLAKLGFRGKSPRLLMIRRGAAD
jgi:ribosomal protein S18 acetylase RimI-like enzyme